MSLNKPWSAEWVGFSQHPEHELGFFEFETDFRLAELPEALIIRVSADQRYVLLVNGKVVARGPQRGDERHWHFETIDIAMHLQVGKNSIRAEVANFGRWAPMAQHTVRLGFLFEAQPPFDYLSTPGDWRVRKRIDRTFGMLHEGVGEFYIDVGPGEILDRSMPEGDFVSPHRICRAENRGEPGGGSPWSLIPGTLPPFEDSESFLPKASYVRKDGFCELTPNDHCRVPKGCELLLDFGELSCGYPHLWFTAEPGTLLTITYCESLWDGDTKGNRNDLLQKSAKGYQDKVVIGDDGYASFSPSWWRTFRFVSVRAEPEIPFELGFGFQVAPIGTKFDVEASFEGDDPAIEPIWDICLRTLRLCAAETYFDCPYYEQLQYVGDTRLQALIGYYLGADRTRQRNAINHFHWSMMETGLTQSRYPSRQAQVIPPFSLWWVVMLYDAWMHDPGFDPSPYLRSAHNVLAAYRGLLDTAESAAFWNFGDWIPNWKWGVPSGAQRAEMHLILLSIASWCLAKLEGGTPEVIRPVPEPNQPKTEHAEALWRYWQVLAGKEPDPWDTDMAERLVKCTYFWQFYKHEARMPADYLAELGDWKGMIERGLTTTPETPEPTRSDCHGWSAHPALGYFLHVAGIRSTSPGWMTCAIAPRPGPLRSFRAKVPHPAGPLTVELQDARYVVQCPISFTWTCGIAASTHEPGKYEFGAENLEHR